MKLLLLALSMFGMLYGNPDWISQDYITLEGYLDEMPIMTADTLRGGFYVLPYGRMFARTFILDPEITPLTIDPTAWPDSFVMGSTRRLDLNTISLGASEDIEIRGDTLFLRDRGIQFIFENSTNLFLRFTDTGNLYPLE